MSEKNLVTSVIFNKKFYGHYRVPRVNEPVGQKGSNIVPVTTKIGHALKQKGFKQLTHTHHTHMMKIK